MVALGCDQAGFHLKEQVIEYLSENQVEFIDFGTYDETPVDYPVYAKKVVDAILSGECGKGILICGTGIGISMTANRSNGIRAALCHDVFSAKETRRHNDANILAMGGRVIGAGHALEVVEAFLNTEFSHDERHEKRITLIDELFYSNS